MKKIIVCMLAVASCFAAWQGERIVDPITDEVTLQLSNTAQSGRNLYGQAPLLVIRFRESERSYLTPSIFVGWGVYVGNSQFSTLRCDVRVDDKDPLAVRLSSSTSNEATFFQMSIEEMFLLLADMFAGDEIVVRFTPYGSNPITATFSLVGLTSRARNIGVETDMSVSLAALEEENATLPGTVVYSNGRVIYPSEGGGKVREDENPNGESVEPSSVDTLATEADDVNQKARMTDPL